MSEKRDKQIRQIARWRWKAQIYAWYESKPSRWRIFKYLKWKKQMPRYANTEKYIKNLTKKRG